MIFSGGLACNWLSWTAIADAELRLDLPANNCCDMGGAIKAAKGLCPKVRRIDVFVGGHLDMTYYHVRGGWDAHNHRS